MTDDELVAVVDDVLHQQPRPVVTVDDVAREVDMTTKQVRDRLNTLAETGVINRSLLGNNKLTVYWLPDSDSSGAESDDDELDV